MAEPILQIQATKCSFLSAVRAKASQIITTSATSSCSFSLTSSYFESRLSSPVLSYPSHHHSHCLTTLYHLLSHSPHQSCSTYITALFHSVFARTPGCIRPGFLAFGLLIDDCVSPFTLSCLEIYTSIL